LLTPEVVTLQNVVKGILATIRETMITHRMPTRSRLYLLFLLAAGLFLVGGCTAMPIPLPFNDRGAADAFTSDMVPGSKDAGLPDCGVGGDAPVGDAGPADGDCLECPPADGGDGGTPDAEAGAPADGPSLDVMAKE